MKKIVVIDDIEQVASGVASNLAKAGFNAVFFTSAKEAMAVLEALTDVDLVLTDQNMPDISGMELLKFIMQLPAPPAVILFTGQGDIDMAVTAMKAGASDFITKPFDNEELLIRIKQTLEKGDLAKEVTNLRRKLTAATSFHSIVGKSKNMLDVYELIDAVAKTDVTVLIRGETGTGKEMAARAIHEASDRKEGPFVAVCCTALQHSLLESELFGHEKGAFTGAHSAKAGKMELAAGGTFLLDEIGDTSPEIQSKLLRVLQEKEFERVGGVKPIKLEARILASTNSDLEEAVKNGTFREDLYYRLNVVQVDMPPLREREDSVITLANHFLEIFKEQYSKEIDGFTPAAVEQMIEYDWPGNVRELRNVIERTVLTTSRQWIDKFSGIGAIKRSVEPVVGALSGLGYEKAKSLALENLEKSYLTKYMSEEEGKINRVAERMNVSVRTIHRMLLKHGLDKNDFKDSSVKESEKV